MKVLITGASGFCGQYLSQYLRKQGVKVYSLGSRVGDEKHFQIESVCDVLGIEKALRHLKADFIFHIAGIVKAENPVVIYQVNLEYAISLFNAVRRAEQKNTPVLLVGTSAEYGLVDEKDMPITEDFKGTPYSHYGISKLAQTLAGLAEARKGHPVVIVRPFNIVGAGMPDYLVVGSVAKQIAQISRYQKEPTIEIGNIKSSRDFVNVTDVAKCYWKLIQAPSAYGEIVNICTGHPITVHEIVERMIAFSGKDIKLVLKIAQFNNFDPPVHYGSAEKLDRLIGYTPTFDLDNTLSSVLSHFRGLQ